MHDHKARSLAAIVQKTTYEQLSPAQIERLKVSVLDTLGAAIAAFEAPTLRALRVHIKDFNSSGPCSLIGGVRCAPDMATLHNSGLVGYLDMNDAYIGAHSTTYPSDILPALLATFEYRGGDGAALLTAMAAAYTAQLALCDALHEGNRPIPLATQAAVGAAAGVGRALELDLDRLVNAVNIASSIGSCSNPIAHGHLSEWVHMMRPSAVRHGVEAAFLAMRGISGIAHELDGEDRSPDLLSDYEFDVKISTEDAMSRVSLRKYQADVHAQSAIEAAIHLRRLHDINPAQIEHITLHTSRVPYEALATKSSERVDIVCREEASYSLPFLVSAALLSGQIEAYQFRHRYIRCQEMQRLRAAITIVHDPALDAEYPAKLCQRLSVTMRDGSTRTITKCDYMGHASRPMSWKDVVAKFQHSATPYANEQLRAELVGIVSELERHSIDHLMQRLSRIAPVT